MSKAEERYLECFQDGRVRNCNSKEAFLLGYHQAEKDLADISWIKEVSGVKEMSRAKEEALKAYPPKSIAANYDTINRRDAFIDGYEQAEKDLGLTWENLKLLQNISHEVFAEVANGSVDYYQIYPTQQSFLEEVLKRFKDFKKGKRNDRIQVQRLGCRRRKGMGLW